MRTRAVKLCLALLLVAPAGGCGWARRVYLATTHNIVKVPTGNMVPTINPGSRAAVDPRAYSERGPARFDIVMFEKSPENVYQDMQLEPGYTLYLKRVIGLGGETLAVRGGRVYINGAPLEEPFETVPLDPLEEFGPITIPAGEYFLMGDNRPNSEDGRFWNKPTVRRSQIKGRVVEIFQE